MTHLDITITPRDQARAAGLADAFRREAHADVDARLAELADAGLERSLAVNALLARHLAATLVELVGPQGAQRQFEQTMLDAAVADDE